MDGLRAWMEQKNWNVPQLVVTLETITSSVIAAIICFIASIIQSVLDLWKEHQELFGPSLAHPLGNFSALQEGAPQTRKPSRQVLCFWHPAGNAGNACWRLI